MESGGQGECLRKAGQEPVSTTGNGAGEEVTDHDLRRQVGSPGGLTENLDGPSPQKG